MALPTGLQAFAISLLHLAALMPAAATGVYAEDEVPTSPPESILQPEQEAQVQEKTPSRFVAADHITGDWGGLRERLYNSGVEVFAYANSIFNGNVAGGIHPGHATIVSDVWAGATFDLEKLVHWPGGLFVV